MLLYRNSFRAGNGSIDALFPVAELRFVAELFRVWIAVNCMCSLPPGVGYQCLARALQQRAPLVNACCMVLHKPLALNAKLRGVGLPSCGCFEPYRIGWPCPRPRREQQLIWFAQLAGGILHNPDLQHTLVCTGQWCVLGIGV